ncbi:MAG TPA: L,D-transpeptidase family protein [Bradyrhizobium sp.]|nr:L,D-transpeptidase family protein [Bradyrhizobium sp.]
MRSFLIALAGLMLVTTAAQAKVEITVDKNNQMMTVAVDGVERYHWPVSTGNPSHETPNGTFRTFRMEADHFSKEFDDAPMPHSIFFTKIGHAIHGTESESKLGIPVSHGCVRLSRAHAATLYDLVEKEGVLNTTVTLTGSSQIALARLGRNRTAIARGDIDDSQADASAGQPMMLSPRQAQSQYAPNQQYAPGQYAPNQYAQRPDDGYIYPADGSDDGARYPAPRSTRRLYDAQAYPQQQPYYNNPQYAPPQQAYQPRPYYQPRGFFN